MYIVLTPVKYSLTCEWRRKEFEIGERHTCGAKHRKNFCRASPLFCSTSTISRFCERFRDCQYSLFSFLFAVIYTHSALPSTQPFVKAGEHVPPCPMESAPLSCTELQWVFDASRDPLFSISEAVLTAKRWSATDKNKWYRENTKLTCQYKNPNNWYLLCYVRNQSSTWSFYEVALTYIASVVSICHIFWIRIVNGTLCLIESCLLHLLL